MILIRKFEPNDFQWVIDVERKVFDEHDPYFYMKFYETCSEGFIVAQINGIVTGFVVGFLESAKRGRIFSLAVHPDYQNRMIGSLLLNELINVFKTTDAVEIILEVRVSNTRAKKFYERHGFIQVGIMEKYYTDGENAYLMKLNI